MDTKLKTTVAWLTLLAIFLVPVSAFGQTKISYHSNKFKVEDDVKVGREAANEVERRYPIIRDREMSDYLDGVGRRLVSSIPAEFQHPEFQYTFKLVNASDINAFALPGGPMYVNRGMIEAARTEGEMAGVMAHEISHVALRHGTAQATKAQKYGTPANILGIGGAILGGPAGAVAQMGAQGVGVYFLKFSREYETEADILGAQILARAGYDPRDLANMFQTIERQGGGGGPSFLSDHPSPKDRYERINREAQMLRVNNPIGDSREFARGKIQAAEYVIRAKHSRDTAGGQRYPTEGDGGNYPNTTPRGSIEQPSTRYRAYNAGPLNVSVPENWRELREGNSVWFVPEGGYGSYNGQTTFTHGVNFGVAGTNNRRSLQQGTEDVINSLAQGNPNLRRSGSYERTTMSGRTALVSTLANRNEATGQNEDITVVTSQMRNGDLLYMVAVSPQQDSRALNSVFTNILRSIKVND